MSGVMFWVRHDFVDEPDMQRFLRIERLVGEQDLHRLDAAQLLCEQAWTGRHYRAIVLKFYTGLRARWDRPNSGQCLRPRGRCPTECTPSCAADRTARAPSGPARFPAPRTARLAERAHNTVVISAGVVAQELVEYRQRIFGAFE